LEILEKLETACTVLVALARFVIAVVKLVSEDILMKHHNFVVDLSQIHHGCGESICETSNRQNLNSNILAEMTANSTLRKWDQANGI
jgi:hypothetical protein